MPICSRLQTILLSSFLFSDARRLKLVMLFMAGCEASAIGIGQPDDMSIGTPPDLSDGPNVPEVCRAECGPTERCEPERLGLDDNCNGLVDEGCACQPGTEHSCFKGNPSSLSAPTCFPGTERCTDAGTFGPCQGGVHDSEGCATQDISGCHAVVSAPFAIVNLSTGSGNFRSDALPGSETWSVTCPSDVVPCPGVTGMPLRDAFRPLQSGEYKVTYTKQTNQGSHSCTFPLIVRSRGLRVELQWEHNLGGTGVDLDLIMHQPGTTQPWSFDNGKPHQCSWMNCTLNDFLSANASVPQWFADPPAGGKR